MKFPRFIEVDGYDDIEVEPSGPFTTALTVSYGTDSDSVVLELYASESKALRKALKAAEALLQPPIYLERNTTV